MGAWGPGPFDNDDAQDWVEELRAEGLPAAGAALADVLSLDGEYIEAPVASRAIAAAEVVAALAGHPSPGLPDSLVDWLGANGAAPDPGLLRSAAAATRLVLGGSELSELWSESGEFAAWQEATNDLISRLTVSAT